MNAATLASPLPTLLRSAQPDDLPFIGATWSQNWWQESAWGARVRWPIFSAGHREVIRRVLARAQCVVASDAADPTQIFGYLVYEPTQNDEPPALQWAYVKPAFRRLGLFTSMLRASGLPEDLAGAEVVHCTRAWFSRHGANARPGLEAKYPAAVHNPFRAFEDIE